jgi:hypothetical protein
MLVDAVNTAPGPCQIIYLTLFISKRVALKIIHSLQQRNICRGEFGMFIPKRDCISLHNNHPLLDLAIRQA